MTVEAFASGKAVVTCTDSGGPTELVRDGETGLVVRADAGRPGDGARPRDGRSRAWPNDSGGGAAAQAAAMTWPDAVKRLVIV